MDKRIASIPIVLALYTILICMPSSVYAKQGVRQQIQLKAGAALQQIKSDSDTPIRARWHRNRGTVRSLYNLTLPAPVGTLETSAHQCLSNYCDLFAMTDPNIELRLTNIQSSLTGRHVRFHQYHNGIEVYGAAISLHTNHSGQIRVIHSNYFPQINISTVASLTPEQAISIAIAESGTFDLRKPPYANLVIFPNHDAGRTGDYANAYYLAYRTIVHSRQPIASWEYIIDANTGEPLQRRNLLRSADGRGRVFNPNPVVALKDFTLMDRGDSADAIPEEAYTDVILPELDGSGFLDGPYVSTRLTENRANEPTLGFNYLRDDPRFEEVMVYYHVDAVGRYLKGLGFDFVDNWQISVNVHFGMTRAGFYDDSDDSINFGDAGVDVAEDAEVIVHEYGHAILDRQVPNIYQGEGGAIHEGFSDFLAASFLSAVSDGFSDSIVFEWAGSDDPEVYTRPVNGNKRYPKDIVGAPHADGQIWSAALWEIFEAMGRDASIRLVVESHFFLSPDAELVDAASAIFVADQELNGGVNFDFLLGVMENRGFFTPPRLASDAFEENDTAETAAAIELPFVNEALSIHAADNDDYYQFHLDETMQVGLGIDFQPIYGELMLTLTGPNGVALVTFETKDIASLELVPGDYLVAVSGINGATNDYKLVLIIDNHGNTPDTATPVAIGDTIESFIDFRGDTDFFAIEGEEGQRIDITITTKDSNLDSLLVIYGPDGKLFAKSDDVLLRTGPEPIPELNPRGIDSHVNEKLPTDGMYLFAVSNVALPNLNAPFGGLNYSYTLTIRGKTDDHAACGSGEETPLTFDEPVTGVITLSGDPASPDPHDSDGFRFEASAGTVIALRVELERPNREVIFWVTQLNLLNASGETLVSTRGGPNGLEVGIDGFLIPADGEYCVDIAGFIGGAVGSTYSYTLTLSEGELPEDDHEGLRGNPTPLTIGEPVEGAISFPGDADAFQFTATTGQIITLAVNGQPAGPFFRFVLTLYNSDLQILMEVPLFVGGFDPILEGFEIPVDGTYYAEIRDLAGGSGANLTYTLTLTVEEADGAGRFPPYDVNQDGVVDIFDLVLVGQHFGEKFINATPTADFGQLRSASPEGELRLLMTPSATDTRQLTVSIQTTEITDLYGYHFSIQYDPAVLELLTTSPSPVLASALHQSYWYVSQHGTRLDLIQTRQGTIEGVAAEGSLATLVFNVNKTGLPSAQPPIQLVDLQLADSLTRAIPVEVVGERVSVRELFPEKPMLLQNYPNPFNPETWIPYQLSTNSEVVISIYDTQGERVRQLDLGYQHVGTYITHSRAAYWDGEDMYGEPVASGLYFYQIRAGAFSASRKMVILK